VKRYEQFDHTADIGVRIFGRNLKELFENAAFALFDIAADLEGLTSSISLTFDIKAENLDELLLSWLDELLFNFCTKSILFFDFKIKSVSKDHLTAKAFGRHVGENKNRLKTEIKAVTYHELKIQKVKSGFEATVIFDV